MSDRVRKHKENKTKMCQIERMKNKTQPHSECVSVQNKTESEKSTYTFH